LFPGVQHKPVVVYSKSAGMFAKEKKSISTKKLF
jgi:hypothetical protein